TMSMRRQRALIHACEHVLAVYTLQHTSCARNDDRPDLILCASQDLPVLVRCGWRVNITVGEEWLFGSRRLVPGPGQGLELILRKVTILLWINGHVVPQTIVELVPGRHRAIPLWILFHRLVVCTRDTDHGDEGEDQSGQQREQIEHK